MRLADLPLRAGRPLRPHLAWLLLALVLTGCVSPRTVSEDADANYALVFKDMREPRPTILHSRLERTSTGFGLWWGSARNGEWEFELLASRAWVDQAKTGFQPTRFPDFGRRPTVAWWQPDEARFDAYQVPYSSYAAAHLYVEKNPQNPDRIRVFIQRH